MKEVSLCKNDKIICQFIDWHNLSRSKDLNIDLIDKYADYLDWNIISTRSVEFDFSFDYLMKYKDKFVWKIILLGKQFNAEQLEKIIEVKKGPSNSLFYYFCNYQNLEESFIEKYIKYVHFMDISRYSELSESFIEKYILKLNMRNISRHQKLSKGFIEKYKELLSITALRDNENLDFEYRKTL